MPLAPIRAFQILAAQERREEMVRTLHFTIVILRQHGKLDAANRLSEMLYSYGRGYLTDDVPELRGFPNDPPV